MRTQPTSLREYQERLLARLRDSAASGSATSYLGMMVAGERWVVQLTDVSEVVPLPPLYPIPLTREWLLGVVNVRGTLYTVIDLAAFAGHGATALGAEARLVLIHPKFRVNAGFVIARTLGLRNPQPQRVPFEMPLPWLVAEYHDSDGSHWKALDIRRLVADSRFLDVGRSEYEQRGAQP
ncbi:chemotaxis protein CheW [Pelomicrobium sp.]|jgi:twitching motility protein PilI|uniref:chemotaxis protein CheW n=1 Tax=Pelomicrobium sp. TaxID=2815319 RepID=UPI002FDDE28E